jgi:mono/diheme cytochrome c family protein
VLRRTLILCLCVAAAALLHAQQPPAAASAAAAGATLTPVARADAAPKGSLKNPYTDSDATVVASGSKLYQSYGCNGCHGGNGGGGMCPPLTNDIWIYGGDDDTLFRLIAYGTQTLQSKGYVRTGTENVVGPMPGYGQIVKTDDDMWRILAFMRANYNGAPECKFGCKGHH